MRPFSFFFHFNKPASLQRGKTTISVHFKGVCHLVDNVACHVESYGRIRKSSPKFVMAGKARYLDIINDKACLT